MTSLVIPTSGSKILSKPCHGNVFSRTVAKLGHKYILSVLAVALGYYSLIITPWFLLPLAWIFTGTALTGFFVIGHDCGHRSFAKRRWVNDLVGHFFMMPLIYPFHSWRIKHNYHHAHTNKLDEDNAWHPIRPEVFENWDTTRQSAFKLFMRKRLWWVGSIGHWAVVHFDWRNFKTKDQSSIKLSVAVVVVFAANRFPDSHRHNWYLGICQVLASTLDDLPFLDEYFYYCSPYCRRCSFCDSEQVERSSSTTNWHYSLRLSALGRNPVPRYQCSCPSSYFHCDSFL